MQRSNRFIFRTISLSLLIAFGVGAAAYADPKEKNLKSVEQQIEQEGLRKRALEAKSRKLLLETAALRRELIEVAHSAQEKEALLTQLESQLSRLVRDAELREAALADQRRQLAGTLGALARLSRSAPQAILIYPGAPTEMVRSALLLRISVPRLGDRAAILAAEIDSLIQVKKDIAGKLLSLRQASAARDVERDRLRRLLVRKGALRRETEVAYRKNTTRIRDLAAKARNLRDLIAGLRVRPETLCRITEFSEHESNGRELDEGERVAVEVLPVLGQSAAAVEPGDGAFDHPTPGLDDEALHPIGSLDDLGLEIGQDAGQGAVKDRPLIGAVGEQFPEKGKQTEQGRQQRETAVAILNVGGGDDAVQQQALRIDQNMPLLALDQLAGIEAVAVDASPPFSALFTL